MEATDEVLSFQIMFFVLEALAFVLSVFGNLIICYVMVFKMKLATPSSWLILSVSVADFLVGIINIPGAIMLVCEISTLDFSTLLKFSHQFL
jgi:hypothetical protein